MKKGFTLVELAIVLVVIGIIIGLAVKGRSLLDNAKIRSDIRKIDKISSAINIYYAQYGRLPGANNKEIFDNLTKNAILKDNDFEIDSLGKYWLLVECSARPKGWFAAAAIKEGGNICAAISDKSPEDVASMSTSLPLRFVCLIETSLDNENWLTGAGRQFAMGGQIPEVKDWDCQEVKDDEKISGAAYLYRIF